MTKIANKNVYKSYIYIYIKQNNEQWIINLGVRTHDLTFALN